MSGRTARNWSALGEYTHKKSVGLKVAQFTHELLTFRSTCLVVAQVEPAALDTVLDNVLDTLYQIQNQALH